MNGECVTLKLDRVIPWTEFKRLSRDNQVKYYEYISERFHVGVGCVAEMFGVLSSSLCTWNGKKGLTGILPRSYTPEEAQCFRDWWQGTSATPVVEGEKPKAPKKSPEIPYFPMTLKTGALNMAGTGAEISQTLYSIFRDRRIEMRIEFNELAEPVVEMVEPMEVEDEPEVV